MILQPVFSTPPRSPPPPGTRRTPGPPTPDAVPPTSPSVRHAPPLPHCPAREPRPDPTNGKHDHTTAACVSPRSPGGPRAVQLPAGSRHGQHTHTVSYNSVRTLQDRPAGYPSTAVVSTKHVTVLFSKTTEQRSGAVQLETVV